MASATPIGTEPEQADQPPAGSRKRKRCGIESTAAGSGPPEGQRKYGVDMDILKCPTCSERFSPPVYQCENGHTVCSACCKKLVMPRCPTCSLPTGSIRCIAVEKVLESLMVCCKYAPYGCNQMLKRTEIKRHERDRCQYAPFRCLVKDCNPEVHLTLVTLPRHLAEEHGVPTVAHNSICGAGFKMESVDYVMVKGDQETDPLFIVFRDKPISGGEIFFCTSLGASSYKGYDLKVKLCPSHDSLSYSMVGARVINLLDRRKKSSLEKAYLFLPWFRSDAQGMVANHAVEVLLRLSPKDDVVEADDD